MTTTLKIEGMHCQDCVRRLTAAFRAVPGVLAASVSLSPPRAEIESDAPVSPGALEAAARAAGAYSVSEIAADPTPAAEAVGKESKPSLYPLALIVLYIAGTSALVTFFRGASGAWSWHDFLTDFMAGFFLVFSFFKFLDLRGFAGAYRSYDLLAAAWPGWGFLYPFLEAGLGLAYLARWRPEWTNAATLALMLAGSVGVFRALVRKDAVRCACLGTGLNLPLTTVTLVEDLGMAAMAAAMLIWKG